MRVVKVTTLGRMRALRTSLNPHRGLGELVQKSGCTMIRLGTAYERPLDVSPNACQRGVIEPALGFPQVPSACSCTNEPGTSRHGAPVHPILMTKRSTEMGARGMLKDTRSGVAPM